MRCNEKLTSGGIPMEGFCEWLNSERGELAFELSSLISSVLKEAKLDTKKQIFYWKDGRSLCFQELADLVQKKWRIKDLSAVYDAIISWMETGYEPTDIIDDEVKMEEFEDAIERWINSL